MPGEAGIQSFGVSLDTRLRDEEMTRKKVINCGIPAQSSTPLVITDLSVSMSCVA